MTNSGLKLERFLSPDPVGRSKDFDMTLLQRSYDLGVRDGIESSRRIAEIELTDSLRGISSSIVASNDCMRPSLSDTLGVFRLVIQSMLESFSISRLDDRISEMIIAEISSILDKEERGCCEITCNQSMRAFLENAIEQHGVGNLSIRWVNSEDHVSAVFDFDTRICYDSDGLIEGVKSLISAI